MKKIWKLLLASAVMSLAVCLGMGTAVFAKTITGELSEDCAWKVDTETGTLTITGAEIPSMTYPEFMEKGYWSAYESDIQHVYLDGSAWFGLNYATSNVISAAGQCGSISWEMDLVNKTLQVNGTGSASSFPWDAFEDDFAASYEVILGDQITAWHSRNFSVHTMYIGAGYSADDFRGAVVSASPENPYYSTYDGAVYTKDFRKLLYYPSRTPLPKLHPDVKVIGKYSILDGIRETLVLPWGVTTIEDQAFRFTGSPTTQVILPDTVTSMQQNHSGGKDCTVLFIYSKSNKAVHSAIGKVTDYFGEPIGKPVDSVAEYYPNVPAAQGGTPPAPEKPPASNQPESKPESSAPSKPPVSSRPESKPSSNSQPATSAPVSQPESSSQQVSSSDASQPAESSELSEEPSAEESSLLESSEESSEESSQTEEPQDEGTGGRISWVLPLIIALGAMAIAAAIVLLAIWKRK